MSTVQALLLGLLEQSTRVVVGLRGDFKRAKGARDTYRPVASIPSEADIDSSAMQFEDWCTAYLRPWFDDHCHADADRLRRWAGGAVDPTRRLPSDLVVAAAAGDDRLRAVVEPFARMDALPASLDSVEPLARESYVRGWRPAVPDGPTRDELAEVCEARALDVT